MTDSPDSLIYKILPRADWIRARDAGRYEGSPDDRRDGFIHFSTATQVKVTLERHFAGQDGLVIAAFRVGDLGEELKFEPSRKGELFPHFYGSLDPNHAVSVHALPLTEDGTPILPPLS